MSILEKNLSLKIEARKNRLHSIIQTRYWNINGGVTSLLVDVTIERWCLTMIWRAEKNSLDLSFLELWVRLDLATSDDTILAFFTL